MSKRGTRVSGADPKDGATDMILDLCDDEAGGFGLRMAKKKRKR
jgi:hypothetical protein